MNVTARTETTVSIASTSTMGSDVGGRISKVLVLNEASDSALASLLSKIEMVHDDPDMYLAPNEYAALLDLRKGAYGY